MQDQNAQYVGEVPKVVNFITTPELLSKLDDFRFKYHFAERAQAIRWLLNEALAKGLAPKGPVPADVVKSGPRPKRK